MDDRNRADGIQIIRTGVFQLRVFGGHQADQLVAGHGVIDQAHRARLANGQGDGGLRVNDQPAQRKDGQLVGDIGGLGIIQVDFRVQEVVFASEFIFFKLFDQPGDVVANKRFVFIHCGWKVSSGGVPAGYCHNTFYSFSFILITFGWALGRFTHKNPF